MKIAEIHIYRMELNEKEFQALRHLVAEGLSYADEVTPAMQEVCDALGIGVAETPTERLLAQNKAKKGPKEHGITAK